MPVKRTAQASPNVLLRKARQERGWSQQKVAELIGVPQAFMVSRWENGTVFPGPGYREKLCTLFQKSSQELGLLKKSQADVPTDPFVPVSIHDPAIPFRLSNAHPLVGRGQLQDLLRQRLCDGESSKTVALYGLPGVGKTALAVDLISDSEVDDHFCDGVLWTGLGPQPNIPALLSRWGTLLGLSEAERSVLHDARSWKRALRYAIGMRRMLLILDDAWNLEDALTCMIGGPHCVYLLTTRLPAVALHFAQTHAIQVPELHLDEGMQLLAQIAPGLKGTTRETLSELVQTVGGLPLALTLMGNYLLIQTHHRQQRRIEAALRQLQQTEARMLLEQPRVDFDQTSHLAGGMPLTLQMMIGMSETILDDTSRQALSALAVLPAKPNTFSEEAALAITAVEAPILDHLVDSGLVETVGQERYQIHQTIVDYARSKPIADQAKERVIAFFIAYMKTHTDNYAAIEQETTNGLLALDLAYERQDFVALIEGVKACAAFLINRGQFATATYQLERAREAARTMNHEVDLAQIWLYLGCLAQQQAQYEQAEQCYQKGSILARHLDQTDLLCSLLAFRGEVAFLCGDYPQAEIYLQEGLTLARQNEQSLSIALLLKNLGEVVISYRDGQQGTIYYEEGLEQARRLQDSELMSALLQNLGIMARRRDDYEQAEAYYREGLTLAHKIGHRHRMSALLLNLGVLAAKRQKTQQARELYQQSLELARLVGSPMRISRALQNLGALEINIGHYQQGEDYLRESLEIAREIGQSWLISETLCEYGTLYLEQKQTQSALAAFEEALTIEQNVGIQELIALSLYGQACALAAQEHLTEAYAVAQCSLRRYEALGDVEESRTVMQLLSTLPSPVDE